MIDFALGYNPFEDGPIEERVDVIRQAIEEDLTRIGRLHEVLRDRTFRNFVRRSKSLAPRFDSAGLSLETIDDESEIPYNSIISVDAVFPSGESIPSIEYLVGRRKINYPNEPINPYFLVVRAIRRRRLSDEYEHIMARAIITGISDEGRLFGERILDPLDINIAREVLGAAYYMEQKK